MFQKTPGRSLKQVPGRIQKAQGNPESLLRKFGKKLQAMPEESFEETQQKLQREVPRTTREVDYGTPEGPRMKHLVEV